MYGLYEHLSCENILTELGESSDFVHPSRTARTAAKRAAGLTGICASATLPRNAMMLDQALHHDTTYLKRVRHSHLCRAEVNGLYERLFYENVLTELGEGSEVIYLSVANAALAHLPYLVALDHQSRQAVLVHSIP